MHGVVQLHTTIDRFEFNFGLAFAKTCDTALRFKLQCVRIGWHDVHQTHLASELGSNRADLDGHAYCVDIGFSEFKFIATWNTGFQNVRVIERLPSLFLGGVQNAGALHVHGSVLGNL